MTDRISEIVTVRAEKVALLAKAEEELALVGNTDEIKAAQQAVELSQRDLEAAQAKNEAALQAAKEKRDGFQAEIVSLEAELHQLTTPQKVRKATKAKVKAAKKTDGTGQRGYKTCPKCNSSVPSRSGVCPKCDHEFVKGAKVAKAKTTKKNDGGSGRGRRGEGEDLATYVIAVLAKYPTGLKLADIVGKVIQAGYKTASQNLAQAVYNVLGKLKKDGKVTKDEETKKFKSHAA